MTATTIADLNDLPRVGEIIDVSIPALLGEQLSLGRQGEIVLHGEYGARIHLNLAALGETVRARVYRRKDNAVWAIVEEVLSPSPDRQEPFCPYFSACGCCQWQHIAYPVQQKLKELRLRQMLAAAGIKARVSAIETARSTTGYRSSVRLSVIDGRAGFVGFDGTFVAIDHCPVAVKQVSEALDFFKGRIHNIYNLVVRGSERTQQWASYPSIPFAVEQGIRLDIFDEIRGNRARVTANNPSALSSDQIEHVLEIVDSMLGKPNDGYLFDCYCNAGLSTLAFRNRGWKVIAIEDNKVAFEDARFNLRGQEDIELYKGQPAEMLLVLENAFPTSTAVFSPRREGIQPVMFDVIKNNAPKRIVYVGQDAVSTARDLSAFVSVGYKIRSIKPIDLAPHTYQVGAIARLELVIANALNNRPR